MSHMEALGQFLAVTSYSSFLSMQTREAAVMTHKQVLLTHLEDLD